MKKLIVAIIAGVLLMFPNIVFAESVKNERAIMSEETYNKLLHLYTPNYIETMTQDEVNNIMSKNLDFENSIRTIKYVRTEINNLTGEVTNTEVSKLEYDNASSVPSNRTNYYETTYKSIIVVISKSATQAYISMSSIWNTIPGTRSFDITAMRLKNLSIVNGTQNGKQLYTLNGTNDFVGYSWNGTNINNQDNGFGISMNILNSNITHLETNISTSASIQRYPITAYGSYQHAVYDITLALSKSYTTSPGGLGNVILFTNSDYEDYYDHMLGVETYYLS